MAVMPYNPLPTPTLAFVLWALAHPNGHEWMHGGEIIYRTDVIRPTVYSILARLHRNRWLDRKTDGHRTLYRLRGEYRDQALKMARMPARARQAKDYGQLLREMMSSQGG